MDTSKGALVTCVVYITALLADQKRRDEDKRAKAQKQEKSYSKICLKFNGEQRHFAKLSMVRELTNIRLILTKETSR